MHFKRSSAVSQKIPNPMTDKTGGWWQTHSALKATRCRLEAEISKHQESLLLKGVLDAAGLPEQQHSGSAAFKRVLEAKQQLVELKDLVSGGEQAGPASAALISALSDRISRFTQLLKAIKQQQRTDYGSLLQQEQQLLEELAVLELTLSDEPLLQPPAHQQHAGPAQAAWEDCSCPAGSSSAAERRSHSRAAKQVSCSSSRNNNNNDTDQQHHTYAGSTGAAADCAVRSPDRPSRQFGHNTQGSSHSPVKGAAPHSSSSSTTTSSSGLPPEVQAYDDFLARHGPTGGWHPDDHKTFMAVLKAHRGDYNAALATAVDALPVHSRQSVIAHCRWHADLCELDMRKRIALVSWRTARDAAKAAFRAQAVALGDSSSGGVGEGLATPALPGGPCDQQQKEAKQFKQQLLQQWKQKQQAAREAAAKAAEEQQRLQQLQERQQRQQRQEELRRRLQAAKGAQQQQHEQEAAAAALQAQRSQTALDPAQRQRLQQRNAAALQRQQQLLAAKKEKQAARERAQQQLLAAAQGMRPQVERDPNRLLSATTAAAARAAAAASSAAEAKEAAAQGGSRGRVAGGFVLHVSHKAVPNWVAGLQGGM